jgi:hypothetical protein
MASSYKSTDNSSNSNSNSNNGGRKSPVCCAYVRAEWALPSFSMKDVNDKTIDLQRSFAPTPQWFVLFVKVFFTGWALQVVIGDLVSYGDGYVRTFYMAYLTHWALTFAELYFVLSLISQVLPARVDNTLSWFIKLLWGIFAVASTLQGSVTVLYWYLEFDYANKVQYFGFMKHGGLLILCLIEGLFVNRVPVRIRHMMYPMAISMLYILWTLIHDLALDVGNPNVNGTDGDDDAIYTSLSWKNRPLDTFLTSMFAVFVLAPLLFFVIFLLSLPLRRYVQDDSTKGQGVEMKPSKRYMASKNKGSSTQKKLATPFINL